MKKEKLSLLPEYPIWGAMLQRCNNPNHPAYKYYGQNGVKVFQSWHKFKNFIADMGSRPTPKHTLDRYPDQKGNYEPGNCRWATWAEQANNRKSNIYFKLNGNEYSPLQLSNMSHVKRDTIYKRLQKGVKVDVAIKPESIRGNRYKTKFSNLYKEWADLYKQGWSLYKLAKKYNCWPNTIKWGLSKL